MWSGCALFGVGSSRLGGGGTTGCRALRRLGRGEGASFVLFFAIREANFWRKQNAGAKFSG